MRKLAPSGRVDEALSVGTAVGKPECSTQTSGQYQCDVKVSSGRQMYLLIGEPGDSPGRVWWVSVNAGD